MIPVTMDADPNIPAMDAYSGSTHLKHKNFNFSPFFIKGIKMVRKLVQKVSFVCV